MESSLSVLEEGEAAGEEEEGDLRAYWRRKRGLQPPVQEGGGGQGGAGLRSCSS